MTNQQLIAKSVPNSIEYLIIKKALGIKINEEVKDKDHSAFLKAMEEDFRWINLVAREQGRLVVDKEDIRSLSIVACEGGWKVDEEEDARKVAWLTEMKDKLSLSIAWS
jgi:hypothetical protein